MARLRRAHARRLVAVLKQGDKITSLVFTGESLGAVLPECRFVVAAAVAAGYRLAGEKAWLDYITGPASLEEFPSSPDKRRIIRVAFDARVKVTFVGKVLDVHEFRACFDDLAWVRANPEHPIAFQRATCERLKGLSADLRQMKPLLHLGRADRDVYIPQDATPEQVHKLLWWFHHGVRSTPPPVDSGQ